jgi:hypothetical protein
MDDPLSQYYASPRVSGYAASVVQIESHKLVGTLLVLSVLSISLASVALGLSVGAKETAARAERETRLQRLETDELKSAVVRAGIKLHLESDSP